MLNRKTLVSLISLIKKRERHTERERERGRERYVSPVEPGSLTSAEYTEKTA